MRDFNHTVNVLVKAYFNDTLRNGVCNACAVGNIINDAIPFSKKDIEQLRWHEAGWVTVFCTFSGKIQELDERNYNGKAKKQIDATGYTWQELAKIEFAFETANGGGSEKMFNGLMAVVDVLADIHGIDLTAKEEAKLLFVKI